MPATKTKKTKAKPKPKPKEKEKVIEAEVIETKIVHVMPDSGELMNLSDVFAKSGMFPSITNKFEAAAVIEYGREIGLKPIISLQTISVIKGKLSIESKALYALAMEKGIKVKIVKKNAEGCTLQFSKKGRDPYTASFTSEDAKRAGLDGKDNYMKYPEEMYFNRCISKGLRAFDPGVLLGIYTVEEMDDFSDSPLAKPHTEKPEEAKEEQEQVTFEKGKKEAPPPKPEPPTEEDPEAKKDVVEILKKYMEDNKIDDKLFKKYLSEELQVKKPDRQFVGLKFGNWSLTEGKLEDLKLLHKNMDLVVNQYLNSETFAKEAKKIEPAGKEIKEG